jgi:hypothetical protein
MDDCLTVNIVWSDGPPAGQGQIIALTGASRAPDSHICEGRVRIPVVGNSVRLLHVDDQNLQRTSSSGVGTARLQEHIGIP